MAYGAACCVLLIVSSSAPAFQVSMKGEFIIVLRGEVFWVANLSNSARQNFLWLYLLRLSTYPNLQKNHICDLGLVTGNAGTKKLCHRSVVDPGRLQRVYL